MDKITEIVVRYIENLERIERELMDDVGDLNAMCEDLRRDNRLLIAALERIENHDGHAAEIASEALDAMTCKGVK